MFCILFSYIIVILESHRISSDMSLKELYLSSFQRLESRNTGRLSNMLKVVKGRMWEIRKLILKIPSLLQEPVLLDYLAQK